VAHSMLVATTSLMCLRGIRDSGDDGLDPEYLAALLNSRLLSWVLKRYSRAWRGGWFAARNGNLARLPIVLAPQTQQSLIVRLYRACIQGTGAVGSANADLDREIASRVLATAVVDFDAAVEELYALSPRESAARNRSWGRLTWESASGVAIQSIRTPARRRQDDH